MNTQNINDDTQLKGFGSVGAFKKEKKRSFIGVA